MKLIISHTRGVSFLSSCTKSLLLYLRVTALLWSKGRRANPCRTSWQLAVASQLNILPPFSFFSRVFTWPRGRGPERWSSSSSWHASSFVILSSPADASINEITQQDDATLGCIYKTYGNNSPVTCVGWEKAALLTIQRLSFSFADSHIPTSLVIILAYYTLLEFLIGSSKKKFSYMRIFFFSRSFLKYFFIIIELIWIEWIGYDYDKRGAKIWLWIYEWEQAEMQE